MRALSHLNFSAEDIRIMLRIRTAFSAAGGEIPDKEGCL